jgi:hypothetical protein
MAEKIYPFLALLVTDNFRIIINRYFFLDNVECRGYGGRGFMRKEVNRRNTPESLCYQTEEGNVLSVGTLGDLRSTYRAGSGDPRTTRTDGQHCSTERERSVPFCETNPNCMRYQTASILFIGNGLRIYCGFSNSGSFLRNQRNGGRLTLPRSGGIQCQPRIYRIS